MNPIERAISYMGNASRLAEAVGCSVQAVCFWRDGKRKIDAETAMLIERVTYRTVTCEELCPGVDWTYIRGSADPVAVKPATPPSDPAQDAPGLRSGATRRHDGNRRGKIPAHDGGRRETGPFPPAAEAETVAQESAHG